MGYTMHAHYVSVVLSQVNPLRINRLAAVMADDQLIEQHLRCTNIFYFHFVHERNYFNDFLETTSYFYSMFMPLQ